MRDKILEAVLMASRDGIYQRDLQQLLGISKSYCSEQLAYLSDEVNLVSKRLEGGLYKIYHIEYFPGQVNGVVRIGLLKSSEYIPAIVAFSKLYSSIGTKLFYRFYDGTKELYRDFNSSTLEFILAPTQATILTGLMSDTLVIIAGLASGGSGILSHTSGREAILSTELSSMISLASENAGVDLPEEIVSYDDPVKAVEDYISGKFSMIAIWEPYFSFLKEKPGNAVVLDYHDVLGDFPCCCVAVNREYYSLKKDLCESWASEYFRTARDVAPNSDGFREAVEMVSEGTGMKLEIVEKSLGTYEFTHNRIGLGELKRLGINLSSRQVEELFLPIALREHA